MRQLELHKVRSQEGESWYLAFAPGEVTIPTQNYGNEMILWHRLFLMESIRV